MTAQETAWQAAESAAAALAPDADVFGSVDAAGLGASTLAVMRRAAAKPTATASAAMRFWTSVAMAGPVAAARWMGMDAPPPVPVPERDKRFADPAWTDNPAFFALRQAHLATSRLVSDLLEAGSGNAVDDAKAALATGFLLDALAPTNFLLTNPAALKRMFETGGASLVAGASHFVDDVLNNNGRPRQVDTRPFRVGENLAATPGKVVFRNDLMELIQYAPQTPKVHAIPVLASPPWINKYYVMDLAPEPELPGVGGAARAHRVRDLLPQPGLLHGRYDPGRLPHPRPAGRAGRHRRDHRRAQDRHHRPVPGRRADRHAGGLPGREGRRQDRLDHAAQHAARLQRARHPRRLHRREDGAAAGKADGGEGRARGQPDGRHLRHAARQRPDLQLRGVQLADGPGTAGLRHPGLERRQHPHAVRHALVLPALACTCATNSPGASWSCSARSCRWPR